MDTTNELFELLGEIAPELAAADGRLALHDPAWEITQQLVAQGTYAVTIRGSFPELKSRWQSQGQWRGEWPSVIAFFYRDEGCPELLIHEAAHLLPARAPTPDTGAAD